MPVYRAQVNFPYFTNMPRDVITNTWHFERAVPGVPAADYAALTPLLEDFYTGCMDDLGKPNYVVWASAFVKWYNLSDPEPRVPVEISLGMTATGQASSSIPPEIAMVLSFQGDPASGVPPARRRGRVYLGPLGPAVFNPSGSANFPTIAPAAISAVVGQAELLLGAMPTGINWVVWSPTNGAAYPVTNGWVDNEADTQRRRGVDATSRTIWP